MTDGRADGRTDGQTDADGQAGGRTDREACPGSHLAAPVHPAAAAPSAPPSSAACSAVQSALAAHPAAAAASSHPTTVAAVASCALRSPDRTLPRNTETRGHEQHTLSKHSRQSSLCQRRHTALPFAPHAALRAGPQQKEGEHFVTPRALNSGAWMGTPFPRATQLQYSTVLSYYRLAFS